MRCPNEMRDDFEVVGLMAIWLTKFLTSDKHWKNSYQRQTSK